MPHIRGQKIDANGIEITMLDGRKFSVTKADLLAQFQAATGNPTARKNAVFTWLRGRFTTEVGTEFLDPLGIVIDFNTADGTPLELTITG